MLEDIRSQAASLAALLDYHFGAGRRALNEAAARLNAADRIVISGMGASLFAAMPLWYALTARGRAAHLIDASELLHYGGRLCEGALVLLVSRSGATVEIVKLIPALREAGASILGITNESDSPLARESDQRLLVNSGRDEMVAVQTYTGALMTMLLLAAAADARPDDALQRACEAVVRAVAAVTDDCIERSVEWRDFLHDATVIYLIGRGPSMASVHEGALLFSETAKRPSAAISAGAFRHGPVEIVNEHFRAIMFATHAATRELDLELAGSLARMGAKAHTIAPEGSWPIPAVSEFWSPVVEIIPVQVAALRAAEWIGVRPGEFRYVSQVTTSETGFKTL
jgi:glucosamine--fructose-6-phosphate aminotransferase (isomerizing)